MLRQADDWERLDLALAENMARQNLNAVEEARACAMLVDDLGLTKEEVGRRVGRSRVAISNLIRLLDLPEEALELIETGHLTEGHGRAILLCKDHDTRRRLARSARDGAWSVRETERRAREAEQPPEPKPNPKVIHPDLAEGSPRRRTPWRRLSAARFSARARGERCVVEIEFDQPGRGGGARPLDARGGRETRRPGAPGRRYNRRSHGRRGRRLGRLAQPVRARL